MKFTALPCFTVSLRICLLVAAGISHQAIGNAQIDPCPFWQVSLHWEYDNFCKDDTAMLWITWETSLVPDSFFWDAGTAEIVSPTNNDTIFVVGVGLYHGYIVDTSGCIEQSWGMHPGNLPYTPLVDAVIEPSHCHEPTGSIVLSLLPGGLPGDQMSYTWSNGSTDASLYNVSDGTYTVTVSRQNIQGFSCPAVYTYTIPLIDTLDIDASIQMDNSCAMDNGAIDITVSYPDLNYSYEWSNGSDSEDLINLPSGVYTVTVTGPSPCVATATFVIADESSPVDLALVDIEPTYCDLPVGMADITIIGGADPITYEWSNFETTQDASQLTSGLHYITVTGNGNCTAVMEVLIPNYDSLFTVTGTITSNTNCLNPNGSIHLEPDPEGFYSYSWPNSNEEDLINLVGGTYPVKINAGSCVLMDTFFVSNDFSHPSLSATITETMCGDSSGMIDLEVSGGMMPYNYFWSDSSSAQDRVNLAAGFYFITVTGNNGCAVSDTFAIQTESAGFTLMADVSPNTGCVNPNGSIALTVFPADTFSFLWSTGTTTEDIDKLQANSYTVTITHDLLCMYVYSFQVLDSLFTPDTSHLFQISCNLLQVGLDTIVLPNQAGCDSFLIVNTSFLPLDTLFEMGVVCDTASEGIEIEHLIGISGCDSIVVTDYQFTAVDTTLLFSHTCDPSEQGFYFETFTNISGCDSIVAIIISLVNSDTSFVFSSSCDTTQAGTFYYSFSNIFGCDSIVQEEVANFPSQHYFTSATTCKASEAGVFVDSLVNQYGCDSVITHVVSILPGDTSFVNKMTCYPDEVGVENVMLTNQYGCDSVVVVSTTLYPLTEITLSILSDFNGYPISCFGAKDGILKASIQGIAPLEIAWSTGHVDSIITGLGVGMYAVTITDGNECQVESSIELIEPDSLLVGLEIAHPSCFDALNGSIQVSFSGGVEPVLFSIDGITFQESPLFESLGGNMYEISTLDANNCMTRNILFLNTPLPLTVDLGNDQIISQGDSASISAIVNVPYLQLASIEWNALENSPCDHCLTQVVAPVVTTSYSIEIIDEFGCTASDSMTLFVNKDSDIYVPNVFSPNQDQVNDYLVISGTHDIVEIEHLSIYDRWGNVIFLQSRFPANDKRYGWDGTYRGSPLNSGVFTYVIKYKTIGELKLKHGSITLIR